MATIKASRVCKLFIGVRSFQQRFGFTLNFGCNNPLGFVTPAQDLSYWVINTLVPAWQACFCSDLWITGMRMNPAVPNSCIPSQLRFGTPGYPGLISDESCPLTTSVVLSSYSADQIVLPLKKTICSRTFFGPPPEGQQAGGVLIDGYISLNLDVLRTNIDTPFAGHTSGYTWTRVINFSKNPAVDCYTVDRTLIRNTTFTQRRRQIPV